MNLYQNRTAIVSLVYACIGLLIGPTCRKDIQPNGYGVTSPRDVTIVTTEWKFDTPGNLENWTAGNASITVSGGALNVTTTGTDPLLLSPDGLNIQYPAASKFVRIDMKNNSAVTSARIFFITTTDTNWTQAKSKGFTIAANNGYYASYVVDMSTVTSWSGNIRRIRIDPLDPAGGSGQTVNIDYIGVTQAFNSISDWEFETDGNTEGWTWGNASVAVSGGLMHFSATSADPMLFSPDFLGIATPAVYKYVHVDMKNMSGNSTARIYFITDADTAWNQAKSKSFSITSDGTYYGSYIVDMSTVAGWTGTIRRIRVDPMDPAGSGDSVSIDFIRITDNRPYRGVMSPQTGVNSGDIDTLKNIWRANVMRWQIVDPTAPYSLDGFGPWLNQKLALLDNALSLCEPLGIKLLIDMHWTPGGHDNTPEKVLEVFKTQAANDTLVAAWQRIATKYKGNPGIFGYDLINEPVQPTPPIAGLDARTTEITIGNAIRAIDRTTPIFISFAQGDDPYAYKNPTPVPLTNVFYEVHMYIPHSFTAQSPDTVVTYPGNIENQQYNQSTLAGLLGMVRAFQTQYNTRIFVGEFSAARYAPGAASYLQDCIGIFEGYGWSWCYHAYREAKIWNLEYADTPKTDNAQRQLSPPTDRYNVVVGGGLSLNQ